MYCNLSFYIQLHIPELYWYLSYLQLVESKLPIWATYIMFKAWEISTLTWIHSRVRNDREAVVLALFFHQSCLSRMVEAEVIILPNTHHTPCRMTQTNRVQWSISESHIVKNTLLQTAFSAILATGISESETHRNIMAQDNESTH